MILARSISALTAFRNKLGRKSVGFVPTMGDLHEGHLSLIRRSNAENDATILSIFVNPIQFNSKEDFRKYRRPEAEDLAKARAASVDCLFMPTAGEMYSGGFQTEVSVKSLSQGLCGAHRPGHFAGVATVVLKLLNLVRPDRAYFGLKDYQQFKLVERMAADLALPVRIVGCPIVREADGLAMSSRNARLSPEQRRRAARIYRALQSTALMLKSKPSSANAALRARFKSELAPDREDTIEYLELVHPDSLEPLKTARRPFLLAAAVFIGKTRLIDNILIR